MIVFLQSRQTMWPRPALIQRFCPALRKSLTGFPSCRVSK